MWERYICLLMLISTTALGSWQSAGALTGSVNPSLTIAGVKCTNISGSPCTPTPQQCQGTVGTNLVLFVAAAQESSAYTLQVTAVISTAITPEDGLVIDDFETAHPAELPILPVRGEPGEWTTLTGAIATGFGNPVTPDANTDVGTYVLSFPGVSTHTQAQLTLTLSAPVNTSFVYQFLD